MSKCALKKTKTDTKTNKNETKIKHYNFFSNNKNK